MSDFLQPHGLQHARLPCPSSSPRICSNSCPLSRWCHPTISFRAAFHWLKTRLVCDFPMKFSLVCLLKFFIFICFKIFFQCGPFLKSLYWVCYSTASVLCFVFFGPEACGIIAPWPGIKPEPPALKGEVLASGPPGKSLSFFLLIWKTFSNLLKYQIVTVLVTITLLIYKTPYYTYYILVCILLFFAFLFWSVFRILLVSKYIIYWIYNTYFK